MLSQLYKVVLLKTTKSVWESPRKVGICLGGLGHRNLSYSQIHALSPILRAQCMSL